MQTAFAKTAEWRDVDVAAFTQQIMPRNKPAILKGLIRHWPSVQAGLTSPRALADYLKAFDIGKPVDTYEGDARIGGRFFYRDDMLGFNFERRPDGIGSAMERMLAQADNPDPPSIYVQSTPVPEYMPKFADENIIGLLSPAIAPRIWIGNRVTVSTHYDVSDNIACVVAGHRRFTLFPPDQLENLYPGPLEFTPGGAPVSMVTLEEPDLARYPRFAEALKAAECAELEPGDALYIPYMWWHHVRSLDPFNVLVNYWWNDGRAPLSKPYDTLLHALLSFRDLPPNQRAAWRAVFDYYVFQTQGDPLAHLAPEHRGGLGKMPPEQTRHMMAALLRSLTRSVTGQ